MSLPQRACAHDDAPHAETTERVAEVLARIVAELDDVAGRIDASQATIAGAGVPADAARVMAMQDADLSAQRIAGVAGFLRALAGASPAEWRVDTLPATGALKLASLVEAIGNAAASTGAGGAATRRAGDVDLF